LKVAHSLVCDAGAYTYTGNAASLKVAHSLQCAAGSYALSGNAATLDYVPGAATVNYTLTCDAGSYSYAGVSTSLNVAHSLICDAGAYALSGNAATLTYVAGTPEVVVTGGGGNLPKYHPWIHGRQKKDKLYEVADLTPELADAVIEAVAVVAEKREIPNKDLETAKAEKELRKFLKSQEQRWKQEYAQLILLEYERREQEIEDAQIAIMLFEM
jgi:hypothetical protein